MDDARSSQHSHSDTSERIFPRRAAMLAVAPLPIAVGWELGTSAWLGLAGLALLMAVREERRAVRASRRMSRVPVRREPAGSDSWLHLVSGPSRRHILRAALEVAEDLRRQGHRVLLVDAGSDLHLDKLLRRDWRFGLGECLTDGTPATGLAQSTDRTGLFFLARGHAVPEGDWPHLGRHLDQLRPRFGRCVMAIEPEAPLALGAALRDRRLDGWWAGRTTSFAERERIVERLGISWIPLWLRGAVEKVVEAPAQPVAPPVPAAIPAQVLGASTPSLPPTRPIVLDCDLRVIERLRFLVWLHRVRAERARGTSSVMAARPAPAYERHQELVESS